MADTEPSQIKEKNTWDSYLALWSGQICSPGPTQKCFVLVNQGSLYVTDRANNSAERK